MGEMPACRSIPTKRRTSPIGAKSRHGRNACLQEHSDEAAHEPHRGEVPTWEKCLLAGAFRRSGARAPKGRSWGVPHFPVIPNQAEGEREESPRKGQNTKARRSLTYKGALFYSAPLWFGMTKEKSSLAASRREAREEEASPWGEAPPKAVMRGKENDLFPRPHPSICIENPPLPLYTGFPKKRGTFLRDGRKREALGLRSAATMSEAARTFRSSVDTMYGGRGVEVEFAV